jgi:hypothetical protein
VKTRAKGRCRHRRGMAVSFTQVREPRAFDLRENPMRQSPRGQLSGSYTAIAGCEGSFRPARLSSDRAHWEHLLDGGIGRGLVWKRLRPRYREPSNRAALLRMPRMVAPLRRGFACYGRPNWVWTRLDMLRQELERASLKVANDRPNRSDSPNRPSLAAVLTWSWAPVSVPGFSEPQPDA